MVSASASICGSFLAHRGMKKGDLSDQTMAEARLGLWPTTVLFAADRGRQSRTTGRLTMETSMKSKEAEPGTATNRGDELVVSLTEGMAILRCEFAPTRFRPAPAKVDVRAIRGRLRLSQAGFARRFGFGLATVRDWEQGRYQPDQAVRSYLRVIEREPEAVQRALKAEQSAA